MSGLATAKTSQDMQIADSLLDSIPLFSGLDEGQRLQLNQLTRQVHFGKGTNIITQGEPCKHFFLVQQGLVKLYRLSHDGGEKVIELIAPGQSFAEALLFMGEQACYPVHGQAVEDTDLIQVDAKGFRELLQDSVPTCFRIMAGMSQRLHRCIEEIDSLTLHNATYRFVLFLLHHLPEYERDQSTIRLPASKGLIAARLSIQPETLSRILKKLSRDGLLEITGSEILILDLEGLRSIAEVG